MSVNITVTTPRGVDLAADCLVGMASAEVSKIDPGPMPSCLSRIAESKLIQIALSRDHSFDFRALGAAQHMHDHGIASQNGGRTVGHSGCAAQRARSAHRQSNRS